MSIQRLPFFLSLLSLLGFGCSLLHPNFTYSEFSFPHNPHLEQADKTLEHPCTLLNLGLADGDFLSESNKTKVKEYCGALEPYIKTTSHMILDNSLGSFLHDGHTFSWQECLDKEGQPFSRCLSRWSAAKSGMPTGHRSLMDIISKTFQSDKPIGFLLFTFAVLFPILRVCCFIIYQLKNTWKLDALHQHCKKWSMTEVLVLSLLITFSKAHQFSFFISLKEAGWMFVLASILLFVSESLHRPRLLNP